MTYSGVYKCHYNSSTNKQKCPTQINKLRSYTSIYKCHYSSSTQKKKNPTLKINKLKSYSGIYKHHYSSSTQTKKQLMLFNIHGFQNISIFSNV